MNSLPREGSDHTRSEVGREYKMLKLGHQGSSYWAEEADCPRGLAQSALGSLSWCVLRPCAK